ncbi:citramalate synthase [Flexivirga caeni]|uniref:Citramalate synthase n=1 Tax=Flexivirga caeni TaxID=2294115 RepID=A0A3M9M722_9MICO|nr:citramalate synthase [Flexivirga caeni]RNI21296.1 citramalate synthase [Flexivirga caeni]
MTDFHVYDTTLRDGAQQEGLNLSVPDKLAIAGYLDQLGFGFVEGGWPGANPKDTEFFRRAATELRLQHAVLAAFGSTRRAGTEAAQDPQVLALVESGAPVVTLVAKSSPRHVVEALHTTLEENLAMVRDTVSFLVAQGRRVFVDAEHFFDSYVQDPAYPVQVVQEAFAAGAEVVALCDTNGGMLPPQVFRAVTELRAVTDGILGAHCHNDTGCAVANTLAAVDAGATHVQGTVNGYGERTGNADLVTVVANLQLKQGREVVDPAALAQALHLSHAVSEVTNIPPVGRQPYVGASAFAHKAGLHASALKVHPDLYQHTDPALVGNSMRTLVSDMAGRASIELKATELGYDLTHDRELAARTVKRVKDLEQDGWTFDAADASFELLLREEVTGEPLQYFATESWRIITDSGDGREALSEATVKLRAAGRRVVATGEGNGPVNALDHALREALADAYPELAGFELTDFRVRILDASHGTDATTRVLIETSDESSSWQTVGVAPNIVHASWTALVDSFSYGLLKRGVQPRP